MEEEKILTICYYYILPLGFRTYLLVYFFRRRRRFLKSAVKTFTEYFYHPTADDASAEANRYFYASASRSYVCACVIESSDSLKNDYKEAKYTIHIIHTTSYVYII